MLTVGEQFPAFDLIACVSRNTNRAFRRVTHESHPGKWVLYLFWPKDFTPVCATELKAFGDRAGEFADRDTVIVGGSIDTEYVHLAWVQDSITEDLPFPLVADVKRDLCAALGILDPREGVAQRAVFIADPGRTIRHVAVNDFSVGRNPRELLRILDALQTDELCPSTWENGESTIPSTVAEIERLFRMRGAPR